MPPLLLISEVGLSHTTGTADPAQLQQLFQRLPVAIGDRAGAAHLHQTRGLGLSRRPRPAPRHDDRHTMARRSAGGRAS